MDIHAAPGVAVREFPLKPGHGFADYLLYVNGKAAGIVEAKKTGATLTGVETQTAKYSEGVPEDVPAHTWPLPFLYQSTGVETRFTNLLDAEPASRGVWTFHRPEALVRWLDLPPATQHDPAVPGSLHAHLQEMPPIIESGMRRVQVDAVRNLERSMAAGKRRALIQMATGSGKTYTAITSAYRLLKFGHANRILFLVDRKNLGEQAEKEFQGYRTPDDGRLFTELYNVKLLRSNKGLQDSDKVVITTIQRLYSILRGDDELDPALEEGSQFDTAGGIAEQPVGLDYNPNFPIESFDVAFVDESHRSIYTVWRPVLEYFDAYLVGLTATPSVHTLAFFNKNLVMEYGHEQAVADGVNVDYGVYEILTNITESGLTVKAGSYVYKRDRLTRKKRWEMTDEEQAFLRTQLNRDVVAPDQIRTIIRTFRDKLFTDIFPGRSEVPKTLIFAQSDAHADDIVQTVRQEFGKGNDFCQKITYRSEGKPEDLLQAFRNSYNPRIVVTVDLIATGTDVKPLEIVMFMRSVKSRAYFDQMKGRGVRVMNPTDFRQVTPDAEAKDHFMIVDCVGVTETELVETGPLDREPSVSLEKLLERVAMGTTKADTLSTLASRLSRLERRLGEEANSEIREVANGLTLGQIAGRIIRALDPDEHVTAARAKLGLAADVEPPAAEVKKAADALAAEAVKPIASNPKLRETIVRLKTKADQVIDEAAIDELIRAGPKNTEWAKTTIDNFQQFIEQHKTDITALQILYSRPHKRGAARLRFRDVKELAKALSDSRPPLTPEALWRAYETLEKDRVKGAGSKRLVTDVVSLVQFALKEENELVPYPERVAARYEQWLAEQDARGRTFTREQKEWLSAIRDYVATSAEITTDAFEMPPFTERGGLARVSRVFGDDLTRVLDEMNEVLAG
jgi:type I restriction enzyme, R subunit